MGKVDLLEVSVTTYILYIKCKKWWWQHFTNTLGVLIRATWRIYRATNPQENTTLLYFMRSVVQSYLHVDKIASTPAQDFWKSRKRIDDSRLTGRSHWPVSIEKQRRCQCPSCIIGGHFKSNHTTK